MRKISNESEISDVTTIVYFDVDGKSTPDPIRSYAKVEHFQGKDYYFIVRNGNKLVNPLYDTRGIHKYSFTIVKEECFHMYLRFLQTKKQVCFANTERLFYDKG
jgi:hypothetical protein